MIQITCKMFVLMMKGKARTRRCEVSVGRERRQRCDVSPWMRKRKHEVSVQWGWRTRWCKRRLQVCVRRWGGELEVWLEVCLSQECRTEIASESVQLHEASGWEKVVTFALLLKRR